MSTRGAVECTVGGSGVGVLAPGQAALQVRPHQTDLADVTLIPADRLPPDHLTLWPVGGGRFGLDVSWLGSAGHSEANLVRDALGASGIRGQLRQSVDGRGWSVRVGPLPGQEIVRVVGAFLSGA